MSQSRFRIATVAACILFTACESGTTPAPTFTIAATTAATTLGLEQSIAVQITSTRTGGGYIEPATLSASGLPPGVTATFSPAALNETVTSSTMTLSAAIGTALGPMTVGVRATASGVVTQASPFQLVIVDAPQPTYRVLAGVPVLTVVRGGASAEMTISTPRAGGLTTPVTLALEGAPAGTIATLVPNSSTGTSSVLRISVPAATPAGNLPVTVRGTTPALVDRTATFVLQVQPAPGVEFALVPVAPSVPCGQTRPVLYTVRSLGAFAGTFTITADPLPAGITVVGTGITRTLSSGQTVGGNFDVTAAGTCTPGNITIVFRLAGSDGVSATATLPLVVTTN